MHGWAPICSLALAACTIDNPRYEGTGEDPPMDTTGEPEPEPEPEPDDCELHPPQPLRISVALDGEPLAPECSEGAGEIVRFVLSGDPVEPLDGRLELLACEGPECACPPEAPQNLVVELGDDVELPATLGAFVCARMELWTREGPDGCEWGGLVHYDSGLLPVLPDLIATNGLSVPPLSLFEDNPFALDLVGDDACFDLEPCEDGRFPGRYALDALGQGEVSVEGSPVPVELVSTFDGAVHTYVFDNRESSVTLECETRVSWTARLEP